MSQVIFEILTRRQFQRLPRTDPPLEYVAGQAVREGESKSRVIYRGMSLEQFLRLPEAKPALEYINGLVVQKVSPKTTHSVLTRELTAYLREFGRRRRLGSPYPELRCIFSRRALVPDIAFFRRGRIPRDAQGKLVDDVRLPPDLMIEILSPGQTIKSLSARSTWCVAHGVGLCWVIPPRKSRVHVFRPDQPPRILELGDTLLGHDVLPGFALPLTELFGWLYED
jgi:Uma2 family endonuclease